MRLILIFIVLLMLPCSIRCQNPQICDSLYEVRRQILSGLVPAFENESMPAPILKRRKRDAYFKIEVTDADNISMDKSICKVCVEYIVDTDSCAKCIGILRSDDKNLNLIAIERIEKLRFIPARRNEKYIPYYDVSIFTFYKSDR